MSWIKRFAATLRSRKLESDLEKEIDFHLSMRARERAAAGDAPAEAQRHVLERFGSPSRVKEACRDQATLAWLSQLRQDLRYAARNLGKHPGFAAAAAACLAIGIGANASVFSFVDAFLFQPLPPGVVLLQRASGNPVSYPELQDWQNLRGVFDDVIGYTPGERLTVGRGASASHALGETVTANYFRALGVTPAAGRLIAPGDEGHPVAVLGYDFWRSHFFADPSIAGKTVWIDREAFTIAGVASRSFQGMLAPWSTDVWVAPYLHRELLADRRAGAMVAAARLAKDIPPPAAQTALNSLDARLARQYPDPSRPPHDLLTLSRRSGLSGSPVWSVFLAMAVFLMTLVGIIFFIACANVAGLLIARAAARRREILIRLSLGASRHRLVRQLLTESLLLAVLGAAAGIALAFAAGDALAGLLPTNISGGFRFQHGINAHVLAFTLMLAVAAVLLSGLLPAFRASDQNLADAGRSHTAPAGRSPKLRQWLIVAQVAASVLVLTAAGICVRGFQKAQSIDPGFDPARLLTVDLDLRQMHYPPARIAAFYSALKARVTALPGVTSASFADVMPFGSTRAANVAGLGEVAAAAVDARYFQTMGIPLLAGRAPQSGERDGIVVNAALARRFWPGQDPIGKTLRIGSNQALQQVVGLTPTGRYWSLTEPPRPFLYEFASQPEAESLWLAIRAQGTPRSLTAQVADEIQRLDPDLPPMRIQSEREKLRIWLEPQRAAAVLLSILGIAALGLAITGLYALLAQLVAQRTPEIAVRVALGASRASVAGMLLRRSALLVAPGAVLGLAASVAVARLLASLSGQVNPLDAVTAIAVAALLLTVAAAATLAPAYRALSIDPVRALRVE